MTTKMLILLLAVLPLLVLADIPIQVDLWTSPDNQTMVSARGVARNLVTAADLFILRITDGRIKSGIHALSGAEPDHVYMRDPTGNFGDQFHINNWSPSTIIVGVANYELLEYREEYVTLSYHNLTNLGNQSVDVDGEVFYHGHDTVFNSWAVPFTREESEHQIQYNFNLRNGKSKFNYINNWGRGALHLHGKKLVATFNTTLDYQQILNIRRVLLQGRGVARVTYLAGLVGNAVGYFAEGHNGRKFWPFALNSVFQATELPPTFTVTEDITFTYAISFNVEYQLIDMRREVYPGLMYDLEDELILDPTDEDIQRANKYTREMN